MDDFFTTIGNTPLVEIKHLTKNVQPVQVFAKLEWFNPGGSVKDRAGFRMIQAGIKSGKLNKNKIILDATSGNTGIAYAMIGARLGYRVQLVVPKNLNSERKLMLLAYGAELIYSEAKEGTDGAQRLCLDIYKKTPEKFFYPDQYNNNENWRAHFESTGPEIWKQTKGTLTHFVAGLGTSGTFMGTGRFLKKKKSSVQLIAAQPDSPMHGLEGWKHMKTAIRPGIYEEKLADEIIDVSTEEAYDMTRRLAKEEGLFAGVSTGAAMSVSLKLAEKIRSAKMGSAPLVIVTIFPDGGDRYMNEKFWGFRE